MKCEKCDKEMKQAGPFARVKREGEPADKWDGITEYQCINAKCSNFCRIIKINDSPRQIG